MTTPIDIIYNSVYKQCKGAGCDEMISKNAAIGACDDYKKTDLQRHQSSLLTL